MINSQNHTLSHKKDPRHFKSNSSMCHWNLLILGKNVSDKEAAEKWYWYNIPTCTTLQNRKQKLHLFTSVLCVALLTNTQNMSSS